MLTNYGEFPCRESNYAALPHLFESTDEYNEDNMSINNSSSALYDGCMSFQLPVIFLNFKIAN